MLLWAGAAMAQASAASAPTEVSPFFQEAADCSAAYKAGVTARLAQPKTDARDKAILEDTERSFVFIGVAYKQGLRKAEADPLLEEAEQRWTKLPKAEQAKRLAACTTHADKLMGEISFVERYAVQNRAKARVEQQFDKEKKKHER
jgi:hypothetical protein